MLCLPSPPRALVWMVTDVRCCGPDAAPAAQHGVAAGSQGFASAPRSAARERAKQKRL
jgi:hypothetical protein